MRLGQVVLKIRAADTSFGNFIGGTAEFDNAIKHTLKTDMAFVIPLLEDAPQNEYDTGINQRLTERFGVIVALATDTTQKDTLGFLAYDRLHDIRSELLQALLGWTPLDAEGQISYRGGKLFDINNAYLWYQFEFEYDSRISSMVIKETIIDNEGKETIVFKTFADINGINFDDTETPQDFNTIYVNYILSPNANLPHTGDLPLGDNFPDVVLPDSAEWLDLTDNPDYGSFAKGYQSGFKIDKI